MPKRVAALQNTLVSPEGQDMAATAKGITASVSGNTVTLSYTDDTLKKIRQPRVVSTAEGTVIELPLGPMRKIRNAIAALGLLLASTTVGYEIRDTYNPDQIGEMINSGKTRISAFMDDMSDLVQGEEESTPKPTPAPAEAPAAK